MFSESGGRPNDQRGFLHKSFIGRAVGGVAKRVISSTPIGGIATTALGIGQTLFKRPARPVATRTATARPSLAGAQGKESGRQLKFGFDTTLPSSVGAPAPRRSFGRPRGTGVVTTDFGPPQRAPCDFPMVRDREGRCRTPTSGEFGGEQFGVGEAVMGRYGAALEPGSMIIDRAVCLKGMQLGNDGLCYNKGAITNSQRQWPRGRRPLLTGGDMRAIGIASRAGSKLDRTTKRLRALGMMKALPKGRGGRAPHAHAKPVAAVSV